MQEASHNGFQNQIAVQILNKVNKQNQYRRLCRNNCSSSDQPRGWETRRVIIDRRRRPPPPSRHPPPPRLTRLVTRLHQVLAPLSLRQFT
ncbi:Hypothetical protein NTJ_06503 [Nesidiocoris tenuis]|uniref:Uncharacterized protein n=1 Tax=Nesidiocoris tenuis TaxID=355587 RepID=A0ABN7AQG7_9HEMI|nr:Hypothetical protein NTJ_06503 [Nesidiocoris tenuis]